MMREINGIIEEIVFRNDDNGYTVVNLDVNGILVTAVGKFPIITEGQNVTLTGEYVKNNKFGEQFSVKDVKVSAPSNIEGIKKYLASGLISGVGVVTANAIVETFGVDTLSIIEFNPLRLAEVKGVSITKAAKIAQSFMEIKNMQDAVMYLQSLNISTNMAIKIYNNYGKRTIEIVNSNPYKLIEDIDGIGFLSADRIAETMGISKDSEFRIRAGVLYSLKTGMEKQGSTYLPCELLYEQTLKLLQLDISTYIECVKKIIEDLKIDGHIKQLIIDDEFALTTSKFFGYEKGIAQIIATLNSSSVEKNYNSEISSYEKINKITLHSGQRDAILCALNNNFSVITGGPGTGKTTIIKAIIKCLPLSEPLLLAPTGRASKRLSEATGLEAKTIHRALDLDFTDGERAEAFTYDMQKKLKNDLIIIDEVSMVDSALMFYLLKVVKPHAKVVLVGDKDQLPSVGCGNVLSDIISSGLVPVAHLTQIYRQSESSLIITNAHAINNGEMPILDNKSNDFFYENKQEPADILQTTLNLITKRLPNFLNVAPQKIQVLAPMRNGICGVDNLNKNLQQIINPPSVHKTEIVLENTIFRVNDKVMHTVNNYQLEWKKIGEYNNEEYGEGVFNGDIGVVSEINRQTGETVVEFEDGRIAKYSRQDLSQLTLAYAITIHKSQGCEFNAVVLPIVGGAPMICTKNLLYTAVTRAKQLVVLVGKKYNIKAMVENNYTAKRYTMLKHFIQVETERYKSMFS